jgi:CDP-4-dehydro-6-deoxyglucose reductase
MYKIKVEVKGEIVDEFESDGTNTILHDAIFSDVDLSYSCQMGICDMCSCEVHGDVHEILNSIEDGKILTCKSKAKSDLILKYNR